MRRSYSQLSRRWEAAQGLIVAMKRGCDVMDVASNVLGVAVGVGLAVTARRPWMAAKAQ